MTTPSHTELAARNLWETIKILGLQNEKLALQATAAALESPERVQGEVCPYPDCNCPTESPCLKGLPTAPAQYSLPDELYESKDWKAADYAGRVEWLHAMYEAKKKELESFLSMATPSPQAEKQPLSDDWIRSMCKQGWVFDTVKQWVRVTEAAHGIVTKEST